MRTLDLAIVNARLVTPAGIVDGGQLHVKDGRIVAVGEGATRPAEARTVLDARGRFVAPGFVDLQINGSLGLDCASGQVDDILALARLLPRYGCTAFLPTIVTAARERLIAAVAAVAAARRAQPRAGARILGVHIEGPYISNTATGRGAHDRSHIRGFAPAEWEEIHTAMPEGVRLVTLAPEVGDNRSHIRALRRGGVLVAIGHTDANYAEALAAVEQGATLATHVFNAMRGLHHQAPGASGAVLDSEGVAAGVIVDGLHVHPAVVRMLLQAKGLDRVFAVTDASPVAGLPPGDYAWSGGRIRHDGIAPRTPDGRLAGSGLTMVRAVANLTSLAGCSLAEAIGLATLSPAHAVGLDGQIGRLSPGCLADVVILESTEAGLQVLNTIVGGEVAYEAD